MPFNGEFNQSDYIRGQETQLVDRPLCCEKLSWFSSTYTQSDFCSATEDERTKGEKSDRVVTYQPAPSCPPCLSLGVGHGHPLVGFPSGDICSGQGSELQTSGSVAAVTHSLTQQRSPCY